MDKWKLKEATKMNKICTSNVLWKASSCPWGIGRTKAKHDKQTRKRDAELFFWWLVVRAWPAPATGTECRTDRKARTKDTKFWILNHRWNKTGSNGLKLLPPSLVKGSKSLLQSQATRLSSLEAALTWTHIVIYKINQRSYFTILGCFTIMSVG